MEEAEHTPSSLDVKAPRTEPVMWNGYKGHARGIFHGLFNGVAIGLAAGLAVLGVMSLPILAPAIAAIGVHMGAALAMTVVSGFTAVGGIIGAEVLGKVGQAAGNQAMLMTERELNLRYPENAIPGVASPEAGMGHHYEVPKDRDEGKFFFWRAGVPTGIAGGILGGLLAVSGHGAHLLGTAGAAALGAGGVAATGVALAPAALAIGAGTLLGASFGINRGLFKSVFNATDSLLEGRTWGQQKSRMEAARAHQIATVPAETQVIDAEDRQKESYRLWNKYFLESFDSGIGGLKRGALGGTAVGGITGAVLGLGAALLATTVGAPIMAAVVVGSVAAALGAGFGYSIYSEAGYQAAASTMAEGLYEERRKGLAQGRDISFAEARSTVDARHVHEQGLESASGHARHKWFSPKMAAIGLGIGAAAGALIAPILSVPLLQLLGVHGAAAVISGAGAAGTAATHAAVAAHAAPTLGQLALSILPVSAATFGVTGAVMGIGSKITRGISRVADDAFLGCYFPGDHNPNHARHADVPLFSPNSQLTIRDVNPARPQITHDVKADIPSNNQSQQENRHMPAQEKRPDFRTRVSAISHEMGLAR